MISCFPENNRYLFYMCRQKMSSTNQYCLTRIVKTRVAKKTRVWGQENNVKTILQNDRKGKAHGFDVREESFLSKRAEHGLWLFWYNRDPDFKDSICRIGVMINFDINAVAVLIARRREPFCENSVFQCLNGFWHSAVPIEHRPIGGLVRERDHGGPRLWSVKRYRQTLPLFA